MKTLIRVGWELVDLGRYCELLETSRFDDEDDFQI